MVPAFMVVAPAHHLPHQAMVQPMTDRQEEPATEAGRTMLDWLRFARQRTGAAGIPDAAAIIAIEREALKLDVVDRSEEGQPFPAPLDVERLAAILEEHQPMYEDSEAGGNYSGCACGEWPESWSHHVIAHLSEQPSAEEPTPLPRL